jgi:membrane associated rhomboid family serine protease
MLIRLTRAVKVILIACFAAFIVQQTGDQFFGTELQSWFALIPSAFVLEYRFWQIFTYAFLHGDVMHLFLNLMMLVFIGGELESVWGTRRFVFYYFFCSICAGLLYLFLQMVVWRGTGLYTPMVGASGAIYGLLMAYGLIFGERVLLFMMLFPMKAKHFVWILAAIEFMTTVYSGRGGLASAAHLGGMVAGLGYLWGKAYLSLAKKRRAQGLTLTGKVRKKRSSQHLKLVINNEREEESDDEPRTWH